MSAAVPLRWLVAALIALGFAVLAYSGVYELVVVTVPGTTSEPGYVIAYRLNRFTGSTAVCDTSGCDIILGWFGPVSRPNQVAPEKPTTPEKTAGSTTARVAPRLDRPI